MESRALKAVKRHDEGYNCAQSVFCTYADLAGIDEQTACRVAEGFGFGMGGLQQTCGAVTAMFMLAGMKQKGTPGDKSHRPEIYKTIRELSKAFETVNSSTLCRDLKGGNGKPALCSCNDCIAHAALLVEKMLFTEEFQK